MGRGGRIVLLSPQSSMIGRQAVSPPRQTSGRVSPPQVRAGTWVPRGNDRAGESNLSDLANTPRYVARFHSSGDMSLLVPARNHERAQREIRVAQHTVQIPIN